jgi:hypothetical protein
MKRLKELIRGSGRSTYPGHSKKSEDPKFSLEKALDDAYKTARRAGKNPPFRVVNIFIKGDNPLSEYLVYIEADD